MSTCYYHCTFQNIQCLGVGSIVAIIVVIIVVLTVVGGAFYCCNLRQHRGKCFSEMDVNESNSDKCQNRKNGMLLLIIIRFLCLSSSKVKTGKV